MQQQNRGKKMNITYRRAVNKGLRSNVYIRRRTRTSLKLEFRPISKEGCKDNILEKNIIVEPYYGAMEKLLKKINAKAFMGAPKSLLPKMDARVVLIVTKLKSFPLGFWAGL
ncbi:hypothetical protein AABB24_005557 [Solanum stoloniferum]|uniref:Uncharacterized protein n=1 Tax=Solanum stoloniferum TaxID=62892 RepID=A0ABD2UY73_9SOLN